MRILFLGFSSVDIDVGVDLAFEFDSYLRLLMSGLRFDLLLRLCLYGDFDLGLVWGVVSELISNSVSSPSWYFISSLSSSSVQIVS